MSRLFDRERGARSTALTLAGPRLHSAYPGDVISELPRYKLRTETLSNLICVRGLWFYLVRHRLLLNRGGMGHIAAECLRQRRCIVRINLRVIASTRDGDIGHAAVEKILRA